MQKRKQCSSDMQLVNRCTIKVRFNEVDSLKIVWHGEYVKYMEDGRESFGLDYPGLGYLDIYNSGFTAPVVDIHISYKYPLIYGDTAIIETKYIYIHLQQKLFLSSEFIESLIICLLLKGLQYRSFWILRES